MKKESIASFISAALNAPLIAIVTFVPLILTQGSPNKVLQILIAITFGAVLPLSSTYFLVRKGTIPDIYASDRASRKEPILWAMGSYFIGILALIYSRAPFVVTALMACYFVNAIIMLIISLYWKISIHAVGVTGPITALVFQLGARMIPFFLLVLPIAWARVYLKAHNIKQVIAGAILSTLLTWYQMIFYVNFLLPMI